MYSSMRPWLLFQPNRGRKWGRGEGGRGNSVITVTVNWYARNLFSLEFVILSILIMIFFWPSIQRKKQRALFSTALTGALAFFFFKRPQLFFRLQRAPALPPPSRFFFPALNLYMPSRGSCSKSRLSNHNVPLGSSENPYGEARSAEFDGTGGTGWTGWTGGTVPKSVL